MTVSAHDSDLTLLDLMLEDMERAPALYRPTNFWATSLPRIIADLRSHGVESFRRQPSARGWYAPTYENNNRPSDRPPAVLPRVARLRQALGREPDTPAKAEARRDYDVVAANDPPGGLRLARVSESTVGAPDEQFVFRRRRYSRSMLNYLRGLVFFKRTVPGAQVRTVLEIGGGFGTLGEILLKGDDVTYVDVDIPPVAFVASYYLQQVFGRGRIADYAETRSVGRIDLDAFRAAGRAAVIMPWQLPRVVGQVNLFVNFISFQEMEPDVVHNYARHVTALGTQYVLLRNSAKGKGRAPRPGVIGVLEPVQRATYVEAFADFELVGLDSKIYGSEQGDFRSEVMVFTRR